MTDGYSEKIEVEAVLAAIGRLISPGDVLYSAAHSAIEVFRKLDCANERKAADLLAEKLEHVMKAWKEEIVAMNPESGKVERLLERLEDLTGPASPLCHAAREALRVFGDLDAAGKTRAVESLGRVFTAGLTTWAASLYQ